MTCCAKCLLATAIIILLLVLTLFGLIYWQPNFLGLKTHVVSQKYIDPTMTINPTQKTNEYMN